MGYGDLWGGLLVRTVAIFMQLHLRTVSNIQCFELIRLRGCWCPFCVACHLNKIAAWMGMVLVAGVVLCLNSLISLGVSILFRL